MVGGTVWGTVEGLLLSQFVLNPSDPAWSEWVLAVGEAQGAKGALRFRV